MVSVGTIVWLSSELMFFAALFAAYFTIRSVSPELWAQETELLNIPFSTVNTTILVLSSVTCQLGVFRAEDGTLARKIGDLFASFMDTERIATLGTSPILEDLAVIAGLTDKRDLLMLLGHLERYGMGGLFGFYVSADAKNSDEYIVYLGQSGLGLPDEAYYREEQYAEIRDKYAAHMERLLTLVGVENADEVAPRVYELEKALAKHHWDNVSTRDAIKTYNRYTLDELRARLGTGERMVENVR